MVACDETDGKDGVKGVEEQRMEGRLCGRSLPSGEVDSRGRPLLKEFVHCKSPRLEGGKSEAEKVSKYIDKEAAGSSAQEADDKGVPVSHTAVGEKQADLNSPEARRESEARSSQVSPSNMLQAMIAARVLLEQLEDERMQTTATEDFIPTNECIFPLPLPPCRSEKSGEACEQMIFGLNHLAIGRGHGPVPARYPEGLVENLGSLRERFDVWDMCLDPIDFDSFFKKRGVTYAGEEVRLAQTLCWEAVRNSLPEQVGQLDLLDFCTEGTLHYIRHLEDFLVPEDAMVHTKPPKVMVGDDWGVLSRGLVDRGICEVWPVENLYHIGQEPLLNGLFAVGKGEFVGPLETQRLIMNLVPFNRVCEPLVGEVATLPSIASFNSFLLDEGEVAVMSAEDIRCFFYLFQVPLEWRRFLGFNKEVDEALVPNKWKGKRCVLVSKVLPMGFVNSVSIAQHIHRNVVKWSQQNLPHGLGGETEMRRDRVGSSSSALFRVYLDNFDLLERHSQAQAEVIKGTVAETVEALREEYSRLGLPRHPKKATERVLKGEIQGAIVDGELGFAMPRPEKVLLYVSLALNLVQRKRCTLKELQVVCGGFVYFCMFRRPLLCALNEVWRFMEKLKHLPPVVRMPMPKRVVKELLRFILICPLAQMSMKLPLAEHVTCSDASTRGGGFCVSEGLTGYGVAALGSEVRGDIPEEIQITQVLTVGLFDGLGALRLAVDALGIPVAGHLSVEKEPTARRVVESYFPDAIFHEDVVTVDSSVVRSLSLRFPSVGLVLIGAGPPCQGVSGLNASKKGALLDARSSLFQEVPRIRSLFEQYFPWAQVHLLMESVASMSDADRVVMSRAVNLQPHYIDSAGITLCHRPRLYWVSWELTPQEGAVVNAPEKSGCDFVGSVDLTADIHGESLLEAGWHVAQGARFPTFTTSRPRSSPGRRPAGLDRCAEHERQRWENDSFRFPPYQYRDHQLVWNKRGEGRLPNIAEREACMGIPVGYTRPCVGKQDQRGDHWNDIRLTLVGNSWQVGVIAWLVYQLAFKLGLCRPHSVQDIVDKLTPGRGTHLQSLLLRPPVGVHGRLLTCLEKPLLRKLLGLVSIKGEDLMVQSASEPQVKFHRLRTSVPAKLWKWREVAGWSWKRAGDHINILELRAVLTTIRWMVQRRRLRQCRVLHLIDSLVCLHALSRGRSSSQKLRMVLVKVNSLLLAADLHPCWGYVHTSQNPADRPSRRPLRRKWGR